MPSYDSYSDLRLDVLDRAEEETGENQSDFYSLVARALDRAYHGLLNRRPWLFSRAPVPLVLQLEAPITTTITWTQDAYAATLGTSQAKNLTGWKATVENITYRVHSHTPGTAAVTFQAKLQASSLAAAAITLFHDEYDLAEIQETPTAPTLAEGAAGSVNIGAHSYRTTYVSANGETMAGIAASITIAASAKQVSLTAIPTGPPGTVSRKVYRTKAGASLYYLLTTITDNTATTYTDNTADASLGSDEPPLQNTTGAVRHVIGMWVEGTAQQIEGPWTEERLREYVGGPITGTWPPRAFARVNDFRVRFSEYPTQAGLVEVPHSVIPKDLSLGVTSQILVPRNWRYVLSDLGLFHLLDIKHDDRAKTWFTLAEAEMQQMEADDDQKRLGLEATRDRTRKEPSWR